MDNKNDPAALHYDETATIPMAYHEMCLVRHGILVKRLIIGWAVSVVLVVCAFVFLWLQYEYESTTTTEYSGVYNITDSEGNVISSDLTPDDVIHIMESLNGNGKENVNKEP